MKIPQHTATKARLTYTSTFAVTLISVTITNSSETNAFVAQFVVAANELAVPITCSGNISEHITQG